MANESILNASFADLSDFRNTLGANNYYRMAAQPILSAKFDTSTWSPMQTLGTAAAQAFLGAALNAYGQQQDAAQVAKMATVLPQLYSSPMSVGNPGVNPEAFGVLKLDALRGEAVRGELESQRQKDKDEIQTKAKYGLFVDLFGKNKQKAVQAMPKVAEELGVTAPGSVTGMDVADPDDPYEKKAADIRKELQASEPYQNFNYVQRTAQQLNETLKTPGAVKDAALAKLIVQLIEPRMAVNAGESAALKASTSIPEEYKGLIGQALEGASVFDSNPNLRTQMLELAAAAYRSHGKKYQEVFDFYSGEAGKFGIPSDRISTIGKVQPFDQYLNTTPDRASNIPPGMKLQRNKKTQETRLVPQ